MSDVRMLMKWLQQHVSRGKSRVEVVTESLQKCLHAKLANLGIAYSCQGVLHTIAVKRMLYAIT